MRQSGSRTSDGRNPGARKARVALALSMVLGLSVLASAQSLAESAKKEKERREALKKSGAVIVTNADLLNVKKRPSVTNPGTAAIATGDPAQGGVAGQDASPAVSTGQGAPARTAEIAASELEGNPKDVFDRKKADLESRWNTARERQGLLEIKLLSLRQEFGNPINAGEKEKVGRDIDALAPIVAAAQLDEKKAKEELDKFLTGPSAPRK